MSHYSANLSQPVNNLIKIRRALISVSNKSGLQELCVFLNQLGCQIVATSSTYKAIIEFGLPCNSVDSITNFPEILGGRVKTLHPKIFGGILGREYLESDRADMLANGIEVFDVVVCNLYPFQEVLRKGANAEELVENIDIGGVSLLRAAAKNHASISILSDTNDYKKFIENVSSYNGFVSLSFRKQLAIKAFRETAAYDELISATLDKSLNVEFSLSSKLGPVRSENLKAIDTLPESISLSLCKIQPLRYGENPHQNAAFYALSDIDVQNVCSLTNMKCFHGKELSYNNVLDIEHAIRLVSEFKENHVAVILKHNTPCGVGVSSKSIADAYIAAFESDPVSPFGGIVCLTTQVSIELAKKLYETFLEVIIAPSFENGALDLLQKKKNLRLATYDSSLPLANKTIFTHVQGGFLAQSSNDFVINMENITYPTLTKPSADIIKAMTLGMTVVKHVRSNAIVLANSQQTLAIAGGFTNRVDAVQNCLSKNRLSLDNAILASDAFFPFPDSIQIINKFGIKHIVQPGGSVQDSEVIKACNEYGISMIFTGNRHFKH
ncbi:bifunctional phosphoribosylaminoimidazolecarboxamide formyltransferase/IMP cyclohydrolase [Fluviispira multicolorata]|uniref:Bifunctional purine biosynthesis protein PurH n=1 Tax=Fluviispira multicolorata TaxID=2654512 RepID=A0A833N4J7_9BACT|nr:bifunctional phosphoribosylaminoimidazolecarboxamide formyltransferase/IMP cyclohydrolase [Fluviispira multicolorata]KAB8028105.1 bifunctional phosphoribosylaminoimidazolecarboxamide formyltransferase/IMP cyclohydrolase [Fluviispira multicolorata]